MEVACVQRPGVGDLSVVQRFGGGIHPRQMEGWRHRDSIRLGRPLEMRDPASL